MGNRILFDSGWQNSVKSVLDYTEPANHTSSLNIGAKDISRSRKHNPLKYCSKEFDIYKVHPRCQEANLSQIAVRITFYYK